MSFNIRASMLPSYPDCPRRAAAKQFKKLVEAAGFELRSLMPSVGAAVGTAVHAVGEHVLRAKIETGELGSIDDGIEKAMAGFDEEIEPGCEWDDTTANRNAAQYQIKRMAKTYIVGVASKVDPLVVEKEIKADLMDGFMLTGHVDLITRDGWFRDLKTGALERPYFAQLGCYGLLGTTDKSLPEAKGMAIDFVKRCPKSKPQQPVLIKPYPVEACQQVAWEIIQRIKGDVQAFQTTHEPGVFLCNPMSMMCTPIYCPAHGTDFCELTKEMKC